MAIAGAGIGGLTAALSLRKAGLSAHVYETAPEIKPVGAGIVIANNAMQVFRYLGIHEKVAAAGNKLDTMRIADLAGRSISSLELQPFEEKFGVYNIGIHRADLQRILAEELGPENISLNKRLHHVEMAKPTILHFEDGSSVESEYLIGADGLKSIVRRDCIGPAKIRDARQICWRGVCNYQLPAALIREGIEYWGKGKRFGFVQINASQVYWYASVNNRGQSREATQLNTLFADFDEVVLRLLEITPTDNIIVNDIFDLEPIPRWSKGNVCLVGDAAHATTPNLGQGACQAIEDAFVLGELFAADKDVRRVYEQYEKLRRGKALKVVRTSWMLGQVSQWENGLAMALRNAIFRLTPASVNRGQLEELFKLSSVVTG